MNLIVFDIDDTLTKSESQHKTAYLSSMRTLGIHNINHNWKAYAHYTDSYILKVNYENNFDKAFDLSLIAQFEEDMTNIMHTLAPVKEISGAKHFVDYLREDKKYALCFATGSLLRPALSKLEQAGIWHEKSLVASSNQLYEREQIVRHAIEKATQYYRVSAFENIIAIGDGIWDMKTARNLNINFIGVGQKNYDDFQKENIGVHTDNWSNFDFIAAEAKLLSTKQER